MPIGFKTIFYFPPFPLDSPPPICHHVVVILDIPVLLLKGVIMVSKGFKCSWVLSKREIEEEGFFLIPEDRKAEIQSTFWYLQMGKDMVRILYRYDLRDGTFFYRSKTLREK